MEVSSNCSLCKNLINFSEIQLCKECAFRFCNSCSLEHANSMKSIYPPVLEEQSQCSLHNSTNSLFCKEMSCLEAICSTCETNGHNGHTISDIVSRSQANLDSLSNMKKINREQTSRITNNITKLSKWKEHFEKEVLELQTLIDRKRYNLIELVNETFDQQIEKLTSIRNEELRKYSEEITKLEKLHDDIKHDMQLNYHFPVDAPDFKITKYFLNLKAAASNSWVENNINLFEMTSLKIKSRNISHMQIHRLVEQFAGEIHTILEQNIWDGDPEKAFVTKIVYESNCDFVKDLCYDIESGHLYVLTFRDSQYFIKLFSNKSMLREFPIEGVCAQLISLFPNNRILLLHNSKFRLISEDMRQFVSLPAMLSDLKDVLTICSSPCKSYIYMYRKSQYIIKYDPVDDVRNSIFLELDGEPDWMSVNKSLEYVAFTGYLIKGIYVFSYNSANLLIKMGKYASEIRYGFFLPGNIIAMFTEITKSILFLNFPKKDKARKNLHLNSSGNSSGFSRICALAMRSSNAFFVCEKNKIYEIIF